MNLNDLKKTLRPLVKQLVKETMQEELSTVITEIIRQTSSVQIVEQKIVTPQQPQMSKQLQEERAAEKQKQIEERRKRLEEVTKGAYGGVNLFEGTTPAPTPREPITGTKGTEAVASPLAGVDPSDSGVDISGLLKMTGGWKQIR
jgi:hypothetical protein